MNSISAPDMLYYGGEKVEHYAGETVADRNSTVDFLVFTRDAHEERIEVHVQDNVEVVFDGGE